MVAALTEFAAVTVALAVGTSAVFEKKYHFEGVLASLDRADA